ncbi:hypothetical protein [Dongia sp. agr-C8]
MNRIFGTGGLRAVAVAALTFATLLVAAPMPSLAASYTLAFTGTVTATVNDPSGSPGGVFQALGLAAGDTVSGTLTIDNLNENVSNVLPKAVYFNQSATSFTFHLEHPGTLNLDYANSGAGFVITDGAPGAVSSIGFGLGNAVSNLALAFRTDVTGGPLMSLAGLPNTPEGLIALLGGASPLAFGVFTLNDYGAVHFDIALVATTPIPAALPLFASALGGLGFLRWRRRRAAAA